MKLILSLSLLTGVIRAASRLSPPDGSIVVAKSGGDYNTISAAIQSLTASSRDNQTIFIKAGTYQEQVYIPTLRGQLTIYGETPDTSSYTANTVTITHNLSLASATDDDKTATLRNFAATSKILNINVANTYGRGHQALALRASGTQQGYYGCKFTGYQGTILTEVGGTQLFAKSMIEGATDFIFGQYSRVWFDSVDIRVLRGPRRGYITTNGRSSPNDPSYYVINNSTVDAASGKSVPAKTYFLGRPGSEFARVVFQNTYMSRVVNPAGWSQWSTSKPNTGNVMFGEYKNSGAGSMGARAGFATALSSPVAIGDILNDGYESWVDKEYMS